MANESPGLTHTIIDNTGPLLAGWLARGLLRSRFSVGPSVLERSFGLVEIDWCASRPLRARKRRH